MIFIVTNKLETILGRVTNELIQYCRERKGALEEETSKVSHSKDLSRR